MRVTFNSNTQSNRQNPNFGLFFHCDKKTVGALRWIGRGITDIVEVPNVQKLCPKFKMPEGHRLFMADGDLADLAKAVDKDVFVRNGIRQSAEIETTEIATRNNTSLAIRENAPTEKALKEEDDSDARVFVLECLGVNTGKVLGI